MEILGIDIGGSGIKGAPIDTKTGFMLQERYRVPTPVPATPVALAEALHEIVKYFKWKGRIGVGFPAVVQHGIVHSAANIDKTWIGVNAEKLFTQTCGCPTFVVNDADAAGVAEMKYGAGKGHKGSVMVLTIGTGIGSAIFTKGKLIPNTELGHILMKDGVEAEHYTSDITRKNEEMEWEAWGTRFNEYLNYLNALFTPDLFIIGGGVSKKMEKFATQIHLKTRFVPAQLLNEAGIIGAAIYAKKQKMPKKL